MDFTLVAFFFFIFVDIWVVVLSPFPKRPTSAWFEQQL